MNWAFWGAGAELMLAILVRRLPDESRGSQLGELFIGLARGSLVFCFFPGGGL